MSEAAEEDRGYPLTRPFYDLGVALHVATGPR